MIDKSIPPRRFFCLDCKQEFRTGDELADHAEKEHPYRTVADDMETIRDDVEK